MEAIQFNYTVTQAAAVLAMSAKSVRKLIDSGRLKATNIGAGQKKKTYTVSPAAIDEFRRSACEEREERINAAAYAVARQGRQWGRSRFSRTGDPAQGR